MAMNSDSVNPFPGAFKLEVVTHIPRSIDEVFDFFSNAENLQELTPDNLHFEILSPTPIAMATGALIDYRIKIHGIPVKWKTEILDWSPPHHFIDTQIKGPYKLWHHRHTFEAVDAGVKMTDTVHYISPLHFLLNPLFIRRDVERIFAYRTQRLGELFPA